MLVSALLVLVSALLVLANALLVLVSALLVLASAFLVHVSVCKVAQIGKVCVSIPHATIFDNFNGKLNDFSDPI